MSLSAYVGRPWRDLGRGPDGWDCWGLVLEVYRDLAGIDLPAYADSYVTATDRAEVASLIADGMSAWREVPAGSERPLDAVLLTEGGQPCHIGIVERPGLMLHMAPGQASVIEDYRSLRWRRRVAGFYRHKDMTV